MISVPHTSEHDNRLSQYSLCIVCYGVIRLKGECASHIRNEMESLLGQTPDSSAFLQLVDKKWQDHCSSVLTLRNIFLYLDRSFVLQTPNLRSIWDMGLELFRNFLQVCSRKSLWLQSTRVSLGAYVYLDLKLINLLKIMMYWPKASIDLSHHER